MLNNTTDEDKDDNRLNSNKHDNIRVIQRNDILYDR